MNARPGIVLVFLTSFLTWSVAHGQGPAGRGVTDPSVGDGPRAHEFWPAAPEVGELFPDVGVVDDLGAPVNIRELAAENYSVLVLGCLT